MVLSGSSDILELYFFLGLPLLFWFRRGILFQHALPTGTSRLFPLSPSLDFSEMDNDFGVSAFKQNFAGTSPEKNSKLWFICLSFDPSCFCEQCSYSWKSLEIDGHLQLVSSERIMEAHTLCRMSFIMYGGCEGRKDVKTLLTACFCQYSKSF